MRLQKGKKKRKVKNENMMKEMDSGSSKSETVRRYVLGISEFIYDALIEILAALYCLFFVLPFFFFVRMGQYNYTSRWDIVRELQKEFRGLVFGTCKYKEVCESYRKRDELCDKKAGYGCDRCASFEMERGQRPIV